MIATLTRARKVTLVLAGYVGALLLAWGVTWLYVLATDTPDRVSSSGMYAFGDGVVFLGVFALAAIPATVALLYFLRSVPAFWSVASFGGLAIAATAILALFGYLPAARMASDSWWALAPLRLLFAPLLGLAFFLALIFAPSRPDRRRLIAATAIEVGAFACFALILWRGRA